MSTDLDPRIVDAPAMLLGGIRRRHAVAAASTTIPEQWRAFRASGLRTDRAPRALGVTCGFDGEFLEYMTALEVEDFDDLPPSLGRMRVPAQRYAVFFHDGPLTEAGALWRRIDSHWLPRSGFEDAETPAFEAYDHRFDPVTGEGGFEIWFPIRSKSVRIYPPASSGDGAAPADGPAVR